MKYIISESKLKSIIKDKFGLDFTGDIELVDNYYTILNDFEYCFSPGFLKRRLNNNGPFYIISVDRWRKVLYQENLTDKKSYIIQKYECKHLTETEFMNMIGLGVLGLSMKRFIDLYFEEN